MNYVALLNNLLLSHISHVIPVCLGVIGVEDINKMKKLSRRDVVN